jgi:LysW-gamma-L-lysine carboxypeptidase
MTEIVLDDAGAVALLRGLVAIPSLSGQEAAASAWLVEQMRRLGYARAYVDAAGSAVGELGAPDASRVIVLLGHIDTVPGAIPVRVEETAAGPVLYGRGSVDAKGPLATFVAAAARLGDAWARDAGVRLVVVGAVEEEAATSKGARGVRDRFDGVREPVPAGCVIGEPSGGTRVTLGYKGRLLVEMDARQPMAHTAGPDAGVALAAVALWQWVEQWAGAYNADRPKAFDQFQPSLRGLQTHTDAAMLDHVEAQVGLRLPPGFDANAFATALAGWAAGWAGAPPVPKVALESGREVLLELAGASRAVTLRCHAHETAWRSERTGPLVRAFLAAIRTEAPDVAPAFVVKTGTSDMNVVGPAWRCPIVAYGPGDSALDHTPHEHLPLAEYLQAVRILTRALRDFTSFLA